MITSVTVRIFAMFWLTQALVFMLPRLSFP